MRRIALVITSLGSSRRGGGAARALTILANHWAADGCDVRIWPLADPVDRPCFPLNDGIDVVALGGPGAGGFFSRAMRVGGRLARLRTGLRGFRPDVIISFLTGANVQAILASRSLGIPVIVSERTDPHGHPVPAPYGTLRTLTYPWAAAIVVQTEAAARYFPPALRSKIAVIPNAILPDEQPKDTHREQADAVLSVGHLGSPKDHRTLIEAIARLKDSHPSLTLTIYGEGPDRTTLTELVRMRGLDSRVMLPGFTAGIAQKVRNFDVFVFPSRYEGFPNALGEAMSAGLPVIVSDASGNRDLVRDGVNGRVFPVGDVAALASIIAELHGARERREALARSARGVSDAFSEQRVAALWDQVFSRLGGMGETIVDAPTASGSGSSA